MTTAIDVGISPREAVERVVSRARIAGAAWGAWPVRARARVLERFRRLLYRRRHEVIELIVRETGKPAVEALVSEVMVVLDLARYYARRGPRVLAERRCPTGDPAVWRKRVVIAYEPFGVVGVIAPWNYPFMLPAGVMLAALLAGNAVVLKPSERTPGCGALLGALLEAAGVPPGVSSVLPGDAAMGAAVVGAVDKVFFTGGGAAGRAVAAACAERAVPCVLELGGSDPAIVLDDADLDTAASGIVWGRFSHAGQTCVAPKRVFVVASVYEPFVERLVAAVGALRVGPTPGSDVEVGPMIDEAQAAVVVAQLRDALAAGARVVAGGPLEEGSARFLPPTVLVDVPLDSRVMQEETFGPVLPVVRVRDAEEAIRLANASAFGLSASVWGRDRRRALAVARRLKAGSVVINDVMSAAGIAEVPHGGVKASGYGRSHGAAGLLECVRPKALVIDRLVGVRQPWWFGYSGERARWIDGFVRAWHGAGVMERWRGAREALRLLWPFRRGG